MKSSGSRHEVASFLSISPCTPLTAQCELYEQMVKDLRLLCGCGQVPESRVDSDNDSWSGGKCGAGDGRPFVMLLIDGSPCGGC